MRILMLHCDLFEYAVTQETPIAELHPEKRESRLEDVFAYLTCFEKKDENNILEILQKFIEAVKLDTERLGKRKILIYPYAHLSNNLGSAKIAKEFLDMLKEQLIKEGFDVEKSPFGWYKRFTIVCKGHPISESFREY